MKQQLVLKKTINNLFIVSPLSKEECDIIENELIKIKQTLNKEKKHELLQEFKQHFEIDATAICAIGDTNVTSNMIEPYIPFVEIKDFVLTGGFKYLMKKSYKNYCGCDWNQDYVIDEFGNKRCSRVHAGHIIHEDARSAWNGAMQSIGHPTHAIIYRIDKQ